MFQPRFANLLALQQFIAPAPDIFVTQGHHSKINGRALSPMTS